MTRATAENLLSEMGDQLGLPGLKLDANGCCCLAFDGRWLVTLALMPGGRLYLHCPVGTPRTTNALEADVLLTMLQASFMGRGAAGHTLSVGPDRRACVQRDLALADLDAAGLKVALEQLLNTAETWAARLLVPTGAPAVAARTARSMMSRVLA